MLIISILAISIAIVLSLVVYMFLRPNEMEEIADDTPLNPLYGYETPFITDAIEEDRLNQMSHSELRRFFNAIVNANRSAAMTPQPSEENDSEQTARSNRLLQQVLSTSAQSPDNTLVGSGKGVVICSSGGFNITSTIVLIRLLRNEYQCKLPIEIWYRDQCIDEDIKLKLNEMFTHVCIRHINTVTSVTVHNTTAMKPLACLYSQFRHILLIDEHVLLLRRPDELFDVLYTEENDDEEEKEEEEEDAFHSLFWHDHWELDSNALCWKMLTEDQRSHVHYEYGQNSGLVLLDKSKCLSALYLCSQLNITLHSQLHRLFPAPYNKTDRDTWQFSWLARDMTPNFTGMRPGIIGQRNSNDGSFIGNATLLFNVQGDPLALQYLNNNWYTTGHFGLNEVQRFADSQRGSVSIANREFQNGLVYKTNVHDTMSREIKAIQNQLKRLQQEPWYTAKFQSVIKEHAEPQS
jgi:hypothetical protein